MASKEKSVIDDILEGWSARGLGRLFRYQSGLLRTKNGGKIRVGITGMSDVQGITSIDGRAIFTAFEVKTGKVRVTPAQKDWLRMVAEQGGIAAVVYSLDDAIKAKNDWLIQKDSSRPTKTIIA